MIARAALLSTLSLAATTALADGSSYTYVQADRIEYLESPDDMVWDLQGWHGGDLHKFWWKLEGFAGDEDENELQLLHSRAVSPYFDFQIGPRFRDIDDSSETALAIGMLGTAPYGIEIDAALFIVKNSETELRVELERDFFLSQKLALQPRVAFNTTNKGSGQTDIGLRLRYEITRQFAPYVGVSWYRERASGDEDTSLLLGVRFWF